MIEAADPETVPQYGEDEHSDEEISLLVLLAAVLRRRKLVLAIFAAGAAITLGMALTKERTFTSSFSFAPQASPDAGRAGLASLAGQVGLSLGGGGNMAQSPQFYADLLATREVLGPIASDSFAVMPSGPRRPLAVVLEVGGDTPAQRREETMRALRQRVISSSVATRTTGVISVVVRTQSPYLSLEIARRLIAGVNQFNLLTRQSQAREERRFTEGRLAAARSALRAAEDALVGFMRTNRQFANAPELSVARDRLQREIAMHQQVVAALAQNYEDARIREVRDIPVITVIESPVLPAQSDPRGRLKALFVGFVVSIVLAALSAVAWDTYRRITVPGMSPSMDAFLAEWRRVRERK